MKKRTFSFSVLLLLAITSFASETPDLKNKAGIAFTENKGQVHDQNFKPRTDVLYGAMAGNMAFHLKTNGVSYQLYRVDQYKEVLDEKTRETRKEIDQQTIYRIDLNWLNCNKNFVKTEDEVLSGYNNYYLESCPKGALNVKSYKGVTFHNLYKGIDLHYYEKNGELKHDYIVSPNCDYKQIQLQVEGADLSLNPDGTLSLVTPLGKVEEGAPIVFQNGKQLKAKWLITGRNKNILSFEIENYNPSLELIIDPITRVWGTYYGGAAEELTYSCATDIKGNVYLAGYTTSNTSTLVATLGSHQSSYGGGYFDALLVKFNEAGTRLWATYYGGSGQDSGESCSTDASGNVYLSGGTSSTVSAVISTSGSHQPAIGSNNNYDAFLVKFNENGVRLWGTYYGGSANDAASYCFADVNGDVYMTGSTSSSNGISTPGSHQPNLPGINNNAFLVKFNSNGTRLWGTYYGAGDFTISRQCVVNSSGDVYMVGSSQSSTGTLIATSVSHQPTYGGSTDAFLAKFNSNGVRQWATYYGGAGTEDGMACSLDINGDIYMSGQTTTASGTVIATTGSHQSASAGSFDAFLVKFNSSGVRQWGTYYGGSGIEEGFACATDAMGDVYLAGNTNSSGTNIIATAGNHQTVFSGGPDDGYLVRFNTNGVRQNATYYGGPGDEDNRSLAVNATGNVYMAGYTSSLSVSGIATSGSHQSAFGTGPWKGYLVKFDLCDVAPAQPLSISGPTAACFGITATYSTAVVQGAHSYTWSLPASWAGASNTNSISVVPGATGVMTLVTSNLCGVSPQQTLNVTVNVTPTVTVNGGSICIGQSFTISPNGADTYTFSSGPVVSPTSLGTYSVIGANAYGCSDTAVSQIVVYPLPIISLNSGAICIGQSFTLSGTGANTYTYSSGPLVSPLVTTTYSVTGSAATGCTNSAVATITVNSLPVPSITISPGTSLCVGQTATVSMFGADSYTFNPGGSSTSNSISISPMVTTTYTVISAFVNGCSSEYTWVQNVDLCTVITEATKTSSEIKLYPNPTSGLVSIEVDSHSELVIVNALGQIVLTCELETGIRKINLEGLEKGIYLITTKTQNKLQSTKLIIE